MGFLDFLFGGKHKKALQEFGEIVDELVAIPFQQQDALNASIQKLKADIRGSDEKLAAKKIGALVKKSEMLRADAQTPEDKLHVRKVYLMLVAIEDDSPEAFEACRDIEKFIQG